LVIHRLCLLALMLVLTVIISEKLPFLPLFSSRIWLRSISISACSPGSPFCCTSAGTGGGGFERAALMFAGVTSADFWLVAFARGARR